MDQFIQDEIVANHDRLALKLKKIIEAGFHIDSVIRTSPYFNGVIPTANYIIIFRHLNWKDKLLTITIKTKEHNMDQDTLMMSPLFYKSRPRGRLGITEEERQNLPVYHDVDVVVLSRLSPCPFCGCILSKVAIDEEHDMIVWAEHGITGCFFDEAVFSEMPLSLWENRVRL